MGAVQEADTAPDPIEKQHILPSKTLTTEHTKIAEVQNHSEPELNAKAMHSVEQLLAARAESARQRVLAEFDSPEVVEAKGERESRAERTEVQVVQPRSISNETEFVPVTEVLTDGDVAFVEPVIIDENAEELVVVAEAGAPETFEESDDMIESFGEPSIADEMIGGPEMDEGTQLPELTEAEVEWFAEQLEDPELTLADITMENAAIETEPLPENIELGAFVNELRDLIELPVDATNQEAEAIGDPTFNKQVIETLEGLDATQAELAQTALSEVMTAAQELSELLLMSEDDVELAKAELKLEELCAEFLDVLGVEHNEVQLKQFIQSVLKIQKSYQTKIVANKNQAARDRGTHEDKAGGDMPDFVDWDAQLRILLGGELGKVSVEASLEHIPFVVFSKYPQYMLQ